MRAPELFVLLGLLAGAATPALAQQQNPAPAAKAAEPELKFEREVFVYPGRGRQDPFASLAARSDLGPRFEDLSLRGVISAGGGASVALIADADNRIYRLRRGQVVGNARVLDISATRVLFAVEDFGVVRQEQLEMKRKPEGEKK